jgi:cytochrome P450
MTRPQFPEFRSNEASFYPREACYPIYERMRTEKKIFYVPRFLGWVVGGEYEVLTSLLRDDRLSLRFHDWDYYPRIPEAKKNALNRLTDNLLMAKHRADHQRLRRLSVTAFAPRMVDKMMPDIRATVQKYFEQMEAKSQDGSIDIVELARVIPLEILTDYLGVPADCKKGFFSVSEAILGQFNPNTEIDLPGALKGIDMLKEMVRQKRANPQDDLISALATAVEDGDKLSEDEMLSLIASVLAAGPDSTRDHTLCVVNAMAQHPAAWKEVRENRSLLQNATRECFRWDAWGHRGYTRFALEDMEIHGQIVKKGEMIRLSFPVFLLDPEVFPKPNEFNIHRDNLDKVIHFGTGPHYCLGANIARAIYETVINEMLDRYESVELVAPAQYEENVVARHIKALPVRVKKAPLPSTAATSEALAA